jgi:hypothetical protein
MCRSVWSLIIHVMHPSMPFYTDKIRN